MTDALHEATTHKVFSAGRFIDASYTKCSRGSARWCLKTVNDFTLYSRIPVAIDKDQVLLVQQDEDLEPYDPRRR